MQVFSSNADFSSNLQDVREYTLGDPRVICRILSDNLYSNKIGSIVRELSANALDAHRATGKENVPFEVGMPGRAGLFVENSTPFSIRDFGSGLDEEEIYSLYTSYGSSSKRSDSAQIGGFGIGSKSPFAYTDAFTVTSWKHGRMNRYICFLNEEGAPCIKKIESAVSDEPSGMKIEIAIKSAEDAATFHHECESQYIFYDVPPAGGNWTKVVPLYENEHGKIYAMKEFSGRNGSWNIYRSTDVLYGHVNNTVYKLNWESGRSSDPVFGMRDGRIGYNTLPFGNAMCVLNIHGMNVDLSASREELGFTEKTKKSITDAWCSFIRKAWDDIISSVNKDAEHSRFEAIWKWKKKGLNFNALQNWISTGYGSIEYLNNLHLSIGRGFNTLFLVEADKIEMMLQNGLRAYEATKSSSRSDNPQISKMAKRISIVEDRNGTLVQTGFRNDISIRTASRVSNGLGHHMWLLNVGDYCEIRLVFVNKDATFTAIKEKMKVVFKNLPSQSIVHVYPVEDIETRKMIVKAYGDPAEDKIIEVAFEKKEKVARNSAVVLEKREKVKVRINNDVYNSRNRRWHHGGGEELLVQIRSGLGERWMSKDEMEAAMADGSVVLITNGSELSKKYNPSQKAILSFEGRCLEHKVHYLHKKWILLNETSYQKLLNLGFKPLDAEYSKKVISEILKYIGVDFKDFLRWCVIHLDGDEFNFQNLKDHFRFGKTIAPYHVMDAAVCRTFLIWEKIKDKFSCIMNSVNSLPRSIFDEACGLYSSEERIKIFAELEDEMGWTEIREWIEANPILKMANHVYAGRDEEEKYAEILNRYLVWRKEEC